MQATVALGISELSQVGEARRVALALANSLGFTETDRGKVGLVVTELANNLIQHAREGQLLLQTIAQPHSVGIEILALDQGPGMTDLEESLRDGFSTARTLGTGLGAVKRLSNLFDIYSNPDQGTAILTHLWAQPSSAPSDSLQTGVICLPKAGETVSGDAWAKDMQDQRYRLLVADGLGHGPLAAAAALEAVRTFEAAIDRPPQFTLEATHAALRSTRGAAVAVAEIDTAQGMVRFAGVGNIAAAVLLAEKSHSMVSYNGTVGHDVRKIQEFSYPWHPGGLLIMHSDGLSSQWRLERYWGLRQRHPSLIAGVLYRDFYRQRDDVTVLVAGEAQA